MKGGISKHLCTLFLSIIGFSLNYSPAAKLGALKKYPIHPILAASKLRFIACRPGNSRAAEFNFPEIE